MNYKNFIFAKDTKCAVVSKLEPWYDRSGIKIWVGFVQSLSHVCLFAAAFSMPGFSVLHYLQEFAQTHVHWVGDAIQPSPSLLLPSTFVCNVSNHQEQTYLGKWAKESWNPKGHPDTWLIKEALSFQRKEVDWETDCSGQDIVQ